MERPERAGVTPAVVAAATALGLGRAAAAVVRHVPECLGLPGADAPAVLCTGIRDRESRSGCVLGSPRDDLKYLIRALLM